MTVLDVDTDVYTEAGQTLVTAAANWFAAVNSRWNTLAACGDMCGSYDEAKKWAADYDTKAEELITGARKIAEAASNYGCILLELGYLHALADYNANIGAGPAPAEPSYPTDVSVDLVCRPPLPSAGGPGNGLIDASIGGSIGLLEKVGIVVPDGNADRLGTAAETWAQLAAAPEVTGFAAELDRIASLFAPITTPELDHIDEDLRALQAAASDTATGFAEMAATTTEHRDGLLEMRAKIRDLLEQLVREIAIEIAVQAAITIVASAVSFGIAAAGGAALAAARIARIVDRYAPLVRPFVTAFKMRGLGRGFAHVPDFSRHKQEMQRLLDLSSKRKGPSGTSWVRQLSDQERRVLADGPYKDGNLTTMLRRGDPLSPSQQQHLDDFNAALAKLPAQEGPVVRHTNLSAEELAAYERGKPCTEVGFTSTTTNPAGVQPQVVHNANVEFQIVSKNGRVYDDPDGGGPFGNPGEVMFPSGTQFFVHNKYLDPATGKTIVQMSEM